jgi:gliding motility-associated lipoprotein GldH
MKIKIVLFSLLSLIYLSCNQGVTFSQFDTDFELNRWEEKNIKEYNFTIDDDIKEYDLIVVFSHVYGYQFNSVPIKIEIINPANKTENMGFDLQIIDKKGKQIGDCAGDVCDLKYVFKEKTKLQKGNYTVKLSHAFNGPYLPNVIGVGLNVEQLQ